MRNTLLLVSAAGLLSLGLACSSSSSSSAGNGSTGLPGLNQDFAAFVKQQVVTKPETTAPVDVSQATFTGLDNMNPDTYDDVLGIPSATIRENWSTVR